MALLADIKKAFLNLEIDEENRRLRLLWVENISEKDKMVVYRFIRVVFGHIHKKRKEISFRFL